jgi:predicted nucleotidyltransferase
MANKEIIDLLKKYILLLNKEGISVHKAYLYGSHSTGQENKASDIDVMIVSDKCDESNDEIIGKMWKLTRQVDSKIEPFLVGTKKFNNDDTSPLLYAVRKNGIEIS